MFLASRLVCFCFRENENNKLIFVSCDDDDYDVEEVVHTVAPGDSLYGVAIAYDVDPRDLIVSNRSSSFCSRSSSSKRKSCISLVFEFLIQKYATSSIEKNKM